MSGRNTDADPDAGSEGGDREGDSFGPVERPFTCTACGYAMSHRVGPLRADVGAVCHNCGDWSVQSAPLEEVVEAARGVAGRLAGPVLTERQALAYLLREHVGIDREAAAAAMGSSASNVDNLHRRGREKVDAARDLVDALDSLDAGGGADDVPTEESTGG